MLGNLFGSRSSNQQQQLLKASPMVDSRKSGKKADWRSEDSLGAARHQQQRSVDDMTLLNHVTTDGICQNIQQRFNYANPQIYTYIGHVLISVNPYLDNVDQWLYNDETLRRYPGRQRVQVAPHVFAIAEDAYRDMREYARNQCVIISGESGAGKTEAAKRILQYITTVSQSESLLDDGVNVHSISQKILASSPILEAFGNAKTLRNHNSSRFGKYLEIIFNGEHPVGAICTNYLLEKARVVAHTAGERSFHIFYQLCAGATDEEKNDYCIYSSENYHYLNQGNSVHLPNMDDRRAYHEVKQAMSQMGVSETEQNQIVRILAGVLWLGNITFREQHTNNQTSVTIDSTEVLSMVAYLLGMDELSLADALTYRTMGLEKSGRATVYKIPMNSVQACAARDALGKFVYDALFNWVVRAINSALAVQMRSNEAFSIGLLDIYGFEIFTHNSFEQLCINYVNEKLQQIFVELTLKSEQEEYVRENIKWNPIPYFNNKIVCELIEERRPPGVFSILNDVVATAHADIQDADRSFGSRLNTCSTHPHFQIRGAKFLIKHYAGDVLYDVDGMAEKNKDSLNPDILQVLSNSQFDFLRDLFLTSYQNVDSKGRRRTAADCMKQSANELVDKLMQTRPSYVRCIKPNDNQVPNEFDTKRVVQQIQYLGLLENLRVRRAGFCHRQSFESFLDRFFLVSRRTSYAGEYRWSGSTVDGCICILKDAKIHPDEWQIGKSKIFIRHPETLWALEHLRTCYWHHMAGRIQRAFRNYQRRKLESALAIQRVWRKWRLRKPSVELRHDSAKVYHLQKQRRRFSTLDMRVFNGDYLAVEQSSLYGVIRSQKVLFSAECELLTERFLRSPKLVPYLLIMTATNLIVVDPNTHQLIHNVPIRSFCSCSTSTNADDCVVLHVSEGEPSGDLALFCIFKTELLLRLSRIKNHLSVTTQEKIKYFYGKGRKEVNLTFLLDATKPEGWTIKGRVVTSGPGQRSNWKPVQFSSNNSKPKYPVLKKTSPAVSMPQNSHEVYRAIYDYVAGQPDELSIVTADKLIVLDKGNDGWWKAQIVNSPDTGLVPYNYLEPTTETWFDSSVISHQNPLENQGEQPSTNLKLKHGFENSKSVGRRKSQDSYCTRPPSIVAPPPPPLTEDSAPLISQKPLARPMTVKQPLNMSLQPPLFSRPSTLQSSHATRTATSKPQIDKENMQTDTNNHRSQPPPVAPKPFAKKSVTQPVRSVPVMHPNPTNVETSQDRIEELLSATRNTSVRDRIAKLKSTDAQFGIKVGPPPTASRLSSTPSPPPVPKFKPRLR